MSFFIDQSHIDQFRTLVLRRLGLQFDDSKLEFLADVIRQRMDVTRHRHFDAYTEFLLSPPGREEFRVLAEQLTVVETFFFRNADNFRAFTQHVLPERLRANAATRRLRILSAGCASGEEPHTLAILLREALPELSSWDVTITGIDLNPSMLAKGALGRYSGWSMRATPDEARRRYFRQEAREFVLDADIRKMVTFHERNLVEEDLLFWQPFTYDIIFCRNVLMYFSPEIMQQVVKRFNRSLLPDGFLFLGHAETLRGISQDFHLCHTHDTFYYRRRDESDVAPVTDSWLQLPIIDIANRHPILIDPMEPWVEVIQQASARIASLRSDQFERNAVPHADADLAPTVALRAWDFDPVLDAMRRERFSDALVLLSALPSDAHEEPDALLLRAALLVNCGRLEEAEDTCKQLIALDELNAGAYYLLALCREHSGDLSAAMEHDRFAIYLDPGFAMPHLHLGMITRREGDAAEARRELSRALDLLAREDSSRLLLFGGGFSRKTLLQLCSAGLRALEGDG